MTPADTTIGMRLDDDQLARLDAYVARLARQTGLDVTRAAVARSLLFAGLDLADQDPQLVADVDSFAATMKLANMSRQAAVAQLLRFAIDENRRAVRESRERPKKR